MEVKHDIRYKTSTGIHLVVIYGGGKAKYTLTDGSKLKEAMDWLSNYYGDTALIKVIG